MQESVPNHLERLRLKGVVVSIQEKVSGRYQVSIEKMSESEPLITYRKGQKTLSKPEGPVALGKVCGQPAYCAGGNRYIGGMSSIQASVWNVGTCSMMPREIHKWGDPTRKNTDASSRGGATRSSDEASVMGVERRGCVIQSVSSGQPEME